MAWRSGFRLAATGLLAGALAACGRDAKTYPMSQSAAFFALIGTRIDGMAFGEAAHGLPAQGGMDRVVWSVEAGPYDAPMGDPNRHHVLFRLVARLAAVSGGTSVTVDIAPPEGDDAARIAALDRAEPAIARLWRAVAREQVDSVLTRRPFNLTHISQASAMAVLAHLPQIGAQMDAAAHAAQQREEDKVEQAYLRDQRAH